MDETHIWKLMAKALANDAATNELKELEQLLKDKPEWGQAYFYLQNLKVNIKGEEQLAEEEKRMEAEGLRKMEKMFSFDSPKDVNNHKTIPWYRPYKKIGIAASIACLIGMAFFLFHSRQTETRSEEPVLSVNDDHQAKTYIASQATSIELADGTKVWLNRGSTLKCNKTFDQRNREVTLKGEAFFDVAQNDKHPFIVHLKTGISVKVLGTQFNVKAYSNTPIIEAALISGKIALDLNKSGRDRIIMKPNEKVTIDLDKLRAVSHTLQRAEAVQTDQIRINPIDQKIPETAWMEDRLSFYDMPFKELSYELERVYGKKIIFKDKQLEAYHLTGSFGAERLEQVLKALQITTPFNYKIKGDEIILYNQP